MNGAHKRIFVTADELKEMKNAHNFVSTAHTFLVSAICSYCMQYRNIDAWNFSLYYGNCLCPGCGAELRLGFPLVGLLNHVPVYLRVGK